MASLRVEAFVQRVARYRRDVANMLSVEVLSIVSMAIIFPLTLRGLGDSRYGEYTALYLVFGLAGLWVSAAPSSAMLQLVLQQRNETRALLRVARRQALIFAGPAAVIGTVAAVAVEGRRMLLPALAVMTADFAFTTLGNMNMAVVFAVTGIRRTARVRMLTPIVRTIGVVLLAVTGWLSVGTLVGLNVFASGVIFVASVWARRRAVQAGPTVEPTARNLLRYTSYYAASMSTNEIQNEGENLVMASTRPSAELGEYAAAYRIVSISLVPLSAVTGAANRWFMAGTDDAGAQFKRMVRLAVPAAVYGVVVGIGILLFRGVIQWVAGAEFDEVSTIAAWLCLLPLLHGLAELPPIGLLGLGRNRERMFMGFATSALSLLSYLVLVPGMGWRGGVIGTYFTETVSIVAGFWCVWHYQSRADRGEGEGEGVADLTIGDLPAGAV